MMHMKADENNKFRIMQLTDLHLGENKERDLKTMDMIQMIVEKE
jgi:predicted MPP superfamily phosphohydrolase